ncbi:molecular chaperone GrpE [Candidatus Symbiothrix dinenymphae]|nr:molecular chaperone GrpE [Candidatus Symbiothrix dinenymphae]
MGKKDLKKATDDLTNQQKPEEILETTDNLADVATAEEAESVEEVVETVEAEEIVEPDAAKELERVKDAYLHLMAEYDNYRKRTIKEKADLIKNGGEKTLVGLLPIIDDFERALDTVDKATDLAAVKEGVDLIYQKFIAFLTSNGVTAMTTVGEAFDPELHEAVALVPNPDEAQKGKIIDNLQTGYTLNDKVIRHAKVAVAD